MPKDQTTADHHNRAAVDRPDDERSKLPAEQNGGEPTRSRPTFRPRCDILETEKGLLLILWSGCLRPFCPARSANFF